MAGVQSKTSGADHNVMRELNRSLVLDLLKQHSPISRAAIAKAADLAKPTVSAIIDELIHKGLVREIGIGRTTTGGGRPPIMLEFNARSQFVAGVQIGVHRINVVVADARGNEVGRAQRPTGRGKPAKVLETVIEVIRAALAEAKVPTKRLAAVGVCVPGLIDSRTGTLLLAPNLRWKDISVGPVLHAALRVPVFVHNTAQACAVAESIEGAGQGKSDLVFLYVSTGVGAGILTDGRLFPGTSGLAGEIGHCPVGSTVRCGCGKVGCLETVASGAAIEQAARTQLAKGRKSSLDPKKVTAEDVSAAAAEGDALAVEVLTGVAEALGIAVSWLVNLLNPEMVVIGGGIAGVGEPLLGPLRKTASSHALAPSAAKVEVVASTLGDDAEVRGAVLLALRYAERYFRVIFQG